MSPEPPPESAPASSDARGFPFATTARRVVTAASATGRTRALSIFECTMQIRRLLEGRFESLCVEGEISNCRPGPSGHVYLALKDARAVLAAVIWRDDLRRIEEAAGGSLDHVLRDGLMVEATGRLTVYDARGVYQLVIHQLRPAGLGELHQRFIELKERLGREGLFEPVRKRPLPAFPRRVGIVTSPHAAAARDVLNVLRRRFPGIPVVLQAARVQGPGAAEACARALAAIADPALGVDVVLLVRGGGSIEDLWAFNEEVLARAIAACPLPVVSGVGHETDFTIADFVADHRAPTPSAAAELAVASLEESRRRLHAHRRGLQHGIRHLLQQHRLRLQRLIHHPAFESPRDRLNRQRQRLDDLMGRLDAAARKLLATRRRRLDAATARLDPALARTLHSAQRRLDTLEAALHRAARHHAAQAHTRLHQASARLQSLDPRRVLQRGYAIITRQRGKGEEIITRPGQAPRGRKLRIEFAEGSIGAISEGPEDAGLQLDLLGGDPPAN